MDAVIRPLAEHDLAEADRIFRLAFGTYLQLPDPASFMGDADLVASRWRSNPQAAIGAYINDKLVGSNFATNWGSFGFFGPMTVRPDLWEKGIGKSLLSATMERFAQWGTGLVGLFTFPQSPKHLGLYQKFGFWPQHLTPVMRKAVQNRAAAGRVPTYSALPAHERERCLEGCRALGDAVYPGLDVRSEIRAVEAQRLGDTVLVHEGAELASFAICHLGAGSEAGSGAAYVKFGAARPGPGAERRFERLLESCEALAAARGLGELIAGANAARRDACRMMLARGFRTILPGVAMQQAGEPGYNREDVFVIDDWR